MGITYSETADPRVRIARHLARKWRTEVEAEPGTWRETGPEYLTRADALTGVESAVLLFFGTPEWSQVHALRAEVERLTAERDELQRKVYAEKRHNGALMVDADRHEQRALALLPDCEAHRAELQYLRHCVSWYWHNMTDAEEARSAIVGELILVLRGIQCGPHAPGAALDAEKVAAWLEKAIARQDKPLRRTSFPTLADCLHSAHGDCDHDRPCGDFIAEVAAAFGLVSAEQPAPCKPAKVGKR